MPDHTSVGSPLLWTIFIAFIVLMLAIDLGLFRRKSHAIGFREAAAWCSVWVTLATLFGVYVGYRFGEDSALKYFTGYIIELSLSIDNVFVFLVIFSYFGVPAKYQHRVLFLGILGAIVMRAIFIFLGTALITKFHFTIYIFGLILVASGIKLLRKVEAEVNPGKNPIVRLFKRFVPMVNEYREERFFVRENGRLYATPLCLVLVALEVSDLIFAVDSVPAILGITTDEFIVFTSNIFAILGLRSLYFLFSNLMGRLTYLSYGLALVLIFVGCKMLLESVVKIDTLVSLAVITVLIGGSAAASFVKIKRDRSKAEV